MTSADRAPSNLNMQLVHFRSRDLTRLQAHGQFWRLVFSDGSALVAQDEKEIWTVHRMQPPNEEPGPTKDPLGLIYSALGSCGGPFEVKVDEVLLCGYWQGVKGTAEAFRSTRGRVFLAGDAGRSTCSFIKDLTDDTQHINLHLWVGWVSTPDGPMYSTLPGS